MEQLTDSHPVGDPATAFRRVLARCRRVEAENRRLRALLAEQEDQ